MGAFKHVQRGQIMKQTKLWGSNINSLPCCTKQEDSGALLFVYFNILERTEILVNEDIFFHSQDIFWTKVKFIERRDLGRKDF